MSTPVLTDVADLPAAGTHIMIDLRARKDYDAGHAPGAIHLDATRWSTLARSDEGALGRDQPWLSEIGALGIDGSKPVLVYDDGRIIEAARVWFILQWFGVDASVLDGGWPLLRAKPGFEADTLAHEPSAVDYRRPPDRAARVGLVDRHTLRQQLDGAVQILDTRSTAEYIGEDLRSNKRGGHLPGAHLLSHTALLDARGRLNTPDVLRRQFADAGFDADKPVVTHCDGGGRAALAALAAVQAGQPDVRVYYASFADWARDDSCPIVKP